jgi:5-methylthioribose kinase
MSGWLDETDLVDYLIRRRLLERNASASVVWLGGGVSAEVAAVETAHAQLVVKRPLPRLRVEEEWVADSERVIAEARALRLAGQLTPGVVPPVLDLDKEEHVLTLQRAPRDWTNWREELLAGRIDARVGRLLGTSLRIWHEADSTDLSNVVAFIQLRINPFYWTVAERHPDLAARIQAVAGRLLSTRTSFVHGDFSPKNVLSRGDALWVLDWEVAHRGDPSFDIAYLLTHLLLKSVHRPADAERYRIAAAAFLDAYGVDRQATVENIGCLLLARVDGKSPADYLTEPERAAVRALGRSVLTDPPDDVLDAWQRAA